MDNLEAMLLLFLSSLIFISFCSYRIYFIPYFKSSIYFFSFSIIFYRFALSILRVVILSLRLKTSSDLFFSFICSYSFYSYSEPLLISWCWLNFLENVGDEQRLPDFLILFPINSFWIGADDSMITFSKHTFSICSIWGCKSSSNISVNF